MNARQIARTDHPFAGEERQGRSRTGEEQHDQRQGERTGDEDPKVPNGAARQSGHRESAAPPVIKKQSDHGGICRQAQQTDGFQQEERRVAQASVPFKGTKTVTATLKAGKYKFTASRTRAPCSATSPSRNSPADDRSVGRRSVRGSVDLSLVQRQLVLPGQLRFPILVARCRFTKQPSRSGRFAPASSRPLSASPSRRGCS